MEERYDEFKQKSRDQSKGDDYYKSEVTQQTLIALYDAKDYMCGDGFGTDSETTRKVVSGIKGLLFGNQK